MQVSVTFKLGGGNQVGIIVIAPVKEDYYRGFLGPDNTLDEKTDLLMFAKGANMW